MEKTKHHVTVYGNVLTFYLQALKISPCCDEIKSDTPKNKKRAAFQKFAAYMKMKYYVRFSIFLFVRIRVNPHSN